jgi:hypothetical protein
MAWLSLKSLSQLVSWLGLCGALDAGGLSRYFHIDHAEIPLTKLSQKVKSHLRLLLTLRNIMIMNKSLLIQALEQATSHPSRNVNPSPTISMPPYNK